MEKGATTTALTYNYKTGGIMTLKTVASKNLVLKAEYGTIEEVLIWVSNTNTKAYNATDVVGVTNPFTAVNENNCTVKPGTGNVPTSYYVRAVGSQNSLKIKMNNVTCYITRIEVRWNPKKPEPPTDAPVLTKKAANITEWLEPDADAGRDYYQATIYNMPTTEFASAVTEHAEKYYWTLANETTLPVTYAAVESGVTATAAKDAKTKWISAAMAPYAGTPTSNAAFSFGDSYQFDVRVKGANPSGSSAETKLRVVVKRLPAPEIDVEQTTAIEGQTWNEATKTLTYTSNEPKIYLKRYTGTDVTSYYKFGPGTVSTSDYKVSASGIVSPNLWEEGLPEIADGYTTKLQAFSQINSYTGTSQGSMSITYTDLLKKNGKPYTIYLTKRGVDTGTLEAPELEIGSEGTNVSGTGIVRFIGNAAAVTAKSTMQTENPQFEYQFIEPVNGVWAQNPEEGKWQPMDADGYKVTATGRLFVRETDGKSTPNHTSRDFEKIAARTVPFSLDGVADEDLVTISDPLRIVGAYHTVVPNSDMQQTTTRFVYVADANGRVLKLRGEREEGQRVFPANYFDFANLEPGKVLTVPANGITGVVRGIESGLPELWVTTAAMDYSPFLIPAQEEDDTNWNTDLKEVNEVERNDFNKKVVLRGMTFNKSKNCFTSSTGRTVKTYARLLTTPAYSEIIGTLADGVRYTLEGFVGYADGEMQLLPTGAVKVPSLRAPNNITASEADIANGYITVNVITDNFNVYPDAASVRQGTECHYSVNGSDRNPVDMTGDNPMITLAPEDFADGTCTLSVRYVRQNISSQPVTVKFVLHQADPIQSIADFKQAYLNNSNIPDPADPDSDVDYYRYTGSAQVRAVTPHYLYLRDVREEGDAPYSVADKSAHSLLLYNANGWKAPVAMADRPANEPRQLQVGDIITNFALIADRTGLGNLRGYATGFSRTVQLLNAEPVSSEELQGEEWHPVEKDALDNNVTGFGEQDRMVRYRVNNVKVSRTVANPAADETDPNRYVYTLEDIPGKPTLNINNVFEVSQGWGTVYDSNTRYDIEGVVLRNGEDSDGNPAYALAFIDFSIKNVSAPTAPALTLSGDGVNGSEFLAEATLTMTLPEGVDPHKATIWYTTDGSDPMQVSSSRQAYENPIVLEATTIVKAFVAVTGGLPGAVAEQIFTRNANERRFIVNFLDQAQPGVPYHFSGTARVAAKGGEYIFVRGTQGHYLPMHIDNSELIAKINPGNYVSDFVMEAHIIGSDENATVRGAHVTADYAPLFSEPSASKPAGLDKDIEFEPDVVTVITPANARRFVKITGVRLIGSDFESGDGTASRDTEWKLTTEKGAGVDIPVNHNILEPSFNWDDTDQSAAAYYNITGFAMLNEEEQIELWPLEVEKVKSSEPVVPSFSGNITVAPVTADGLTTVEFYPYTTVSLRCPIADPESATIYYYVSANGNKPGENAKWNLYAQPFAVTADAMVTMYAEAPGYEQSAPTYINMKLGKPAGTVKFSVDPLPGKTLVAMTADENAEIYYTTDANLAQDNWTRYTAAVPFTDATMLWAYAKEGNRKGEVSSMNVMVAEPEPTPEEPEKFSGKVIISAKTNDKDVPVVTIVPADNTLPEGSYSIYYTTDESATLTPSAEFLYDGPFEMPNGGIVLAILMENGKEYPGEVASLNVWFVPTAIDGIDSDTIGSEGIRAEGGNIIAPEGSAVFDITGRRVNATGLRAGIYIVRTPAGKAVKVKID